MESGLASRTGLDRNRRRRILPRTPSLTAVRFGVGACSLSEFSPRSVRAANVSEFAPMRTVSGAAVAVALEEEGSSDERPNLGG